MDRGVGGARRAGGPVVPAASLALLVGLAAGCFGIGGEDQLMAANEFAATALFAARERADSVTLEEIFHPDATYDDFSTQLEHRGIDEIVGYLTSIHDWADDVYLNVGRTNVGPATVTAEWFLVAVQARPIEGLVPVGTGREVSLSGVTILEMEGGRIRRAADYFDTAPMLLQLGARVELPGDTVIELDPMP